jgi:hypothetical protein
MKKFLIMRSHGGSFIAGQQGGNQIKYSVLKSKKGPRIKIQPRYKIQYPMKNLYNTNHPIFVTH